MNGSSSKTQGNYYGTLSGLHLKERQDCQRFSHSSKQLHHQVSELAIYPCVLAFLPIVNSVELVQHQTVKRGLAFQCHTLKGWHGARTSEFVIVSVRHHFFDRLEGPAKHLCLVSILCRSYEILWSWGKFCKFRHNLVLMDTKYDMHRLPHTTRLCASSWRVVQVVLRGCELYRGYHLALCGTRYLIHVLV